MFIFSLFLVINSYAIWDSDFRGVGELGNKRSPASAETKYRYRQGISFSKVVIDEKKKKTSPFFRRPTLDFINSKNCKEFLGSLKNHDIDFNKCQNRVGQMPNNTKSAFMEISKDLRGVAALHAVLDLITKASETSSATLIDQVADKINEIEKSIPTTYFFSRWKKALCFGAEGHYNNTCSLGKIYKIYKQANMEKKVANGLASLLGLTRLQGDEKFSPKLLKDNISHIKSIFECINRRFATRCDSSFEFPTSLSPSYLVVDPSAMSISEVNRRIITPQIPAPKKMDLRQSSKSK